MSEFTREVYKNEFGILNLSFQVGKNRGSDTELNLTLLNNLSIKLDKLHKLDFAHLNLNLGNIYFNINTNEVFLGPIKIIITNSNYDENELSYSSPESTFMNLFEKIDYHNNNFYFISKSTKNDIWSIGCIIAEMFFIARIPDRILRIQMGFGSATLAFASH